MASRANGHAREQPGECAEFARWTRRELLEGAAAAAMSATLSSPLFSPWWGASVANAAERVARGPSSPQRDVLVTIFLRGGMDGLTTCVPYGDADLYLARPTLAIAPPGQPDGAIDLDGFFGLAPAAAALQQPFLDGRLLFVHAAGSTDPTRSHFDMFKFLEYGIPEQPTSPLTTGWLARHLASVDPLVEHSLLRAVALSINMPKTLAGAPQTLPIKDLDGFEFPGNPNTRDRRRAVLQRMYQMTPGPLAGPGVDSLATIDLLQTIDFAGYQPAHGASYPSTSLLAQQLKSAAALIKANVGIECLMLERDGWDLHSQFAGQMTQLLSELSQSLLAFYLDLTDELDHVTILVMSEFGRRVAENASMGLDHGHGGCMMLIGGHVRGGRVLTSWPGLNPSHLDQGDVKVTTDYRDVVSEILYKRMQNRALHEVFPKHDAVFPGVIG